MKVNASKLRTLREERGLSIDGLLAELARTNFSVHSGTLRNWEEGKTKIKAEDLAMLAQYYGKSLKYFFEDE